MRYTPHTERAVISVGLLDLEHHPFEHLGALAVAFDDAHVHAHGIARPNGGQVAAAFQLQQISKFRHSSAGTCGEYNGRHRALDGSRRRGVALGALVMVALSGWGVTRSVT